MTTVGPRMLGMCDGKVYEVSIARATAASTNSRSLMPLLELLRFAKSEPASNPKGEEKGDDISQAGSECLVPASY